MTESQGSPQPERTIEDFWYGDEKIHYKKIQVIDGDTISGLGRDFGGLNFNQSVKEWSQPVNKQPGAVCAPRGDGERKAKLIYPNEYFYIPAHKAKGPLNEQKSKEKKFNALTTVRCFYKDNKTEPVKYGYVLYWYYNKDESDIEKDNKGIPVIKIGQTDGLGYLKPVPETNVEFKIENRSLIYEETVKKLLVNHRAQFRYRNSRKRKQKELPYFETNNKELVWAEGLNKFPVNKKIGFTFLPVDVIGELKTMDLFEFGKDQEQVTNVKLSTLPGKVYNRIIIRKTKKGTDLHYREPDEKSNISISSENNKEKEVSELISQVRTIELHCSLPEWVRRIVMKGMPSKKALSNYKNNIDQYNKALQEIILVKGVSSFASKFPDLKQNDGGGVYKFYNSNIVPPIVLNEKATELIQKINDHIAGNQRLQKKKDNFLEMVPEYTNFIENETISKEIVEYLIIEDNLNHTRTREKHLCRKSFKHLYKVRDLLCESIDMYFEIIRGTYLNHKPEVELNLDKTLAATEFEKFNDVIKRAYKGEEQKFSPIALIIDGFLKSGDIFIKHLGDTPGPPSTLFGAVDVFGPYITEYLLEGKPYKNSKTGKMIRNNKYAKLTKRQMMYEDFFKKAVKISIAEIKQKGFEEAFKKYMKGIKNEKGKIENFKSLNNQFSKFLSENMNKKMKNTGKYFRNGVLFFSILNFSKTFYNAQKHGFERSDIMSLGSEGFNLAALLTDTASNLLTDVASNSVKYSKISSSLKLSTKVFGMIGYSFSTFIACEAYNQAVEKGDFKGEILAILDIVIGAIGIITFFLVGGWWLSGLWLMMMFVQYSVERFILGDEVEQFIHKRLIEYQNTGHYNFLMTYIEGFHNDFHLLIKLNDKLSLDHGLSWRAIVPLINLGFVVYKNKITKEIDFDATEDLIDKLVNPPDLFGYDSIDMDILCPGEDEAWYVWEDSAIKKIIKNYIKLTEKIDKYDKNVKSELIAFEKERDQWIEGSFMSNLRPKPDLVVMRDPLKNIDRKIEVDGKIFRPKETSYRLYVDLSWRKK